MGEHIQQYRFPSASVISKSSRATDWMYTHPIHDEPCDRALPRMSSNENKKLKPRVHQSQLKGRRILYMLNSTYSYTYSCVPSGISAVRSTTTWMGLRGSSIQHPARSSKSTLNPRSKSRLRATCRISTQQSLTFQLCLHSACATPWTLAYVSVNGEYVSADL